MVNMSKEESVQYLRNLGKVRLLIGLESYLQANFSSRTGGIFSFSISS